MNSLKTGPQLTPETIDQLTNFVLTKLVVVSAIYSLNDPLGMVSLIMIKYEIFLREFNKLPKLGWSDLLNCLQL